MATHAACNHRENPSGDKKERNAADSGNVATHKPARAMKIARGPESMGG
ncbi:hypothetical protein KKF84_07205 [Myxococcota bacterium]|nr:hypothetical protein [Myxococcota bacterium]MBU1535090.1 hypothetical protein [Myxococcota bacterium]